MNPLEIAEELEHLADITDNVPELRYEMRRMSRKLRAAITEQSPQRKWREEANKLYEMWRQGGPRDLIGKGNSKRECDADLDNYHDEGRGLLQERIRLSKRYRNSIDRRERRRLEVKIERLDDRIRNHLEGGSDES